MKQLILVIAILNSQITYANQSPWDEANKVIEQTKMAAKKDAHTLVEVDVLTAIEKVLLELPYMSDFNKEYYYLISSNEELKNSFSNIAQKDANQISQDQKKVIEVYNNYKSAVRKRFKKSYKSSDMSFELIRLSNMLYSASNELERKCTYGRALSNHDYKSIKIEVPKLEYQLMIKYSTGLDGDGNPSNLGYDYQIQTAAESDALKNAKNINNTLLTANGLIVTTAYSTNTATALNAALVNGAGAIMPYALAISAAAAIATTIAANKEQARLETEVSDAQRHMFYNTADSSDVIKYYKESCKSVVNSFHSVADTIRLLINDKQKRTELLNDASKTRDERAVWQEESTINNDYQDELVLNKYFLSNKCYMKNSSDYDQQREKGNSFCYFSNQKNGFNNGHKEFDFDKNKVDTKIEELESKIKKFGEKYPVEKTTEYLNHQLIEIFSPRLAIIEEGFNKIGFELVDKQQSRAYQKLVQILTYYRKYKLSEDVVFQDLNRQLDVYKSIENIRSDLDKIVALSISEIFSDIGRSELKDHYNQLVKDFEPIKDKYMHLRAVNYLDYSIQSLESYISSL
ncbi:MAG: hypothetical protein MK008_00200 [Bdellovibrionales bacterium]|nr:hypothetical protein [Bdellovibrionales bacterium]